MKFLTMTLVAFLFFVVGKITAQNSITITVTNATSNKGKISYALFTKDNFRGKPLQAISSKIKENKSVAVFKNVPTGEYAIICFHDKNNNDKMDFEPNGMPIEDYGVSNNAMNRFGPPEYEQAKFKVTDKNVSLKIKF